MPGNPTSTVNEILCSLSAKDREWILSRATREAAPVSRPYVQPGEESKNVYFIESGLASMVITLADSSTVEVGTVGAEGLVGLHAFLGDQSGRLEIFQQVAGVVIVLPTEDFQHLLAKSTELNRAMFGFTLSIVRQITMAVACNRLHPVEQRLARWLLMVRDRVGGDEFVLTQRFLSQMLAVRRPGVSTAAGLLQRAGMIRYDGGRIEILQPEKLEEAACECYGVVRRERNSPSDRLVSPT